MKRAVLCPPGEAAPELQRRRDGFSPLVDFRFEGGASERGFQGGKTKAGETASADTARRAWREPKATVEVSDPA